MVSPQRKALEGFREVIGASGDRGPISKRMTIGFPAACSALVVASVSHRQFEGRATSAFRTDRTDLLSIQTKTEYH